MRPGRGPTTTRKRRGRTSGHPAVIAEGWEANLTYYFQRQLHKGLDQDPNYGDDKVSRFAPRR